MTSLLTPRPRYATVRVVKRTLSAGFKGQVLMPPKKRFPINGVTYSCSPDLTNNIDGNITDAPIFIDAAGGDYHVERESPTVEAGTNVAWMIGATDLDGNDRLLTKFVDMGAYETFVPPGGMK